MRWIDTPLTAQPKVWVELGAYPFDLDSFYEKLRTGEIRGQRNGRRWAVSRQALMKWWGDSPENDESAGLPPDAHDASSQLLVPLTTPSGGG